MQFNYSIRMLPLFIFFLLSKTSIAQDVKIYVSFENLYGDITDGAPDQDSLIQIYYSDGTKKGIGKVAVGNEGITNLKFGQWKEYDLSGKINSEGSYKLGSYINCCIDGACTQYYYYGIGLWKFYGSDGKLSHELEFTPRELKIDTNCEGGDKLLFGIVKSIPLKYSGLVTLDTIFENQKIVIE
ncbi:MAG: hypothetical protein ROO71_07275 [Balneola sp.]